MTLADTIALGAAERLASAAGPRAGLAAYRALATNATTSDVRGKALIGALRCASEARDADAARAMAKMWIMVSSGHWEREIVALCKQLDAAGFWDACLEIARTEMESRPGARVAYVVARGLLRTNDADGACRALGVAVERATREGLERFAAAARLLRARILAGHEGRHGVSASATREAIDEAGRVDANLLDAESRIDLAALLLMSQSRFARAGALSILEQTASVASVSIAARAVRLAARHADRSGAALTPLELDRVLATLARWPDESARNTAISRTKAIAAVARADTEILRHAAARDAAQLSPDTAQHLERARSLLAGGRGGTAPRTTDPELRLAHAAIDLVAATRDARDGDAARALADVTSVLLDGGRASASVWTALALATNAGSRMIRADAIVVARRAFDASPAAPARGWLWLAQAMSDARAPDLAVRALTLAVAAGEPSARLYLGAHLRARAWSIAASATPSTQDARLDAAALLAEAKALLAS